MLKLTTILPSPCKKQTDEANVHGYHFWMDVLPKWRYLVTVRLLKELVYIFLVSLNNSPMLGLCQNFTVAEMDKNVLRFMTLCPCRRLDIFCRPRWPYLGEVLLSDLIKSHYFILDDICGVTFKFLMMNFIGSSLWTKNVYFGVRQVRTILDWVDKAIRCVMLSSIDFAIQKPHWSGMFAISRRFVYYLKYLQDRFVLSRDPTLAMLIF